MNVITLSVNECIYNKEGSPLFEAEHPSSRRKRKEKNSEWTNKNRTSCSTALCLISELGE